MSDLFSEGLDNLMKGLSNLFPKDDPTIKFLTARGTVVELKKRTDALYAEIGKMALARDGDTAYGDTALQLRELLDQMAEAQAIIDAAKGQNGQSFKDMFEAQTCPVCGQENPPDSQYCSSCGAKLGDQTCPECGHTNPPGTNFCGKCGAKL
ncbi:MULTISPECIES: zinc ribbon domain-containing protein [Eubacterium]|uniref:Double zinc ribbon n=1 Tax=Eubacterium barkeri TaxID=1528 RepID=A0A1H3AHS7_EUBBA|nr:zinc ribbon domain-containing protein [Eubacterium barkeri]SDX29270.1 Double zinc ribbon [Eubacterium barkeri]